ncbi:MAG: hypothetical protein JWO60_2527 [Frankiales bacterium]|nr:hypothetical protein [Frankiales bacterium]
MNVPTTLAAFGAGLAVVFAAALGVGAAVGPVGATPVAEHGGHADASAHGGADGLAPAGLAVSEDGYTLVLDAAPTAARVAAPLSFRVLGPDGAPVRDYAVEHQRELHLVVVRRDATGFQHLHPARDDAGRWTLPVTLPAPGTYKVFADFVPAGAEEGLVLATDVTVPGAAATVVLPTEQRTAVVDGYTVRLTGDLVAGTSSRLALSVAKDGRPVTDLDPYLGAYGHLVALREGDLAYLHVHPQDGPAGPEVVFDAEVPSAGDYRLFLDFSHDDVVRTAALGLRAQAGASR